MQNKNFINLENTNFIWQTNFAGDPSKDRFGSSIRRASIIIPDVDLAMDLMDEGFNVRVTNPREGEEEGFEPRYFANTIVRYDSKKPPKIYLGSENTPYELLNEDTVGEIDECYVLKVDAKINKYYRKDGKRILYVDVMYVTYDNEQDPYAVKYNKNKYNVEKLAHELDDESAFELLKILEERFA